MYSLRPILIEYFVYFTHIKKKCTSEEIENSFERIVKYWCIHSYHKCKLEYIKLRVMKVILIRVIIEKKLLLY